MNIEKIIIIGLVCLVAWMGISYKFKDMLSEKLMQNAVQITDVSIALAKNDKVKIVVKEKERIIYMTTSTGTQIIHMNPSSTTTITTSSSDAISVNSRKWAFPMLLNISGIAATEIKPVIGIQVARYDKYGISINGGANHLSMSVERDVYDFLPMLRNTDIGLFYNFIDNNNKFGIKIGSFL